MTDPAAVVEVMREYGVSVPMAIQIVTDMDAYTEYLDSIVR